MAGLFFTLGIVIMFVVAPIVVTILTVPMPEDQDR